MKNLVNEIKEILIEVKRELTIDYLISESLKHIEHLYISDKTNNKKAHLNTAYRANLNLYNTHFIKSLIFSLFFTLINAISIIILFKALTIDYMDALAENVLILKLIILSLTILLLCRNLPLFFLKSIPHMSLIHDIKERFSSLINLKHVHLMNFDEIKEYLTKYPEMHRKIIISAEIEKEINTHFENNLKDKKQFILDLDAFKYCFYLCHYDIRIKNKTEMILRIGKILYDKGIIMHPNENPSEKELRNFWEFLLNIKASESGHSIFKNILYFNSRGSLKASKESLEEINNAFHEIGFNRGIEYIDEVLG